MIKLALCVAVSSALALSSGFANAQDGSSATTPKSTASSTASVGKNIYDAAGRRLGAVYRVTADGDLQVILNGKLVTIPASTLSEANGKTSTSLSRADLERTR
jgi:hypothetical protein